MDYLTSPPKRGVKVPSGSVRASIDGVGQEGDQLAPGALNLKSIDI